MRVHYIQFLCNEEGQPIENADIYFLQKDGVNTVESTAAYYFTRSDGGTALKSYSGDVNITTNSDGRFEFWVGDINDGEYGYTWTTTFKVEWNGSQTVDSVTTDYNDNINEVTIFPIIEEVDETNALDSIKDKVTSDYLMANTWLAATKGFLQRPQFEWKDADEIYIDPAKYHLDGTTERVVYWDSQLTFEFGPGGSNVDSEALTIDAWHYVYIDDSKVETLNDNEITVSQLLSTTTVPTWSDPKHGWYSGEDRCIFAVKTDAAAAEILEFWHDSGTYVSYGDAIEDRAQATLGTSFVDVTLTIPEFSIMAGIYTIMEYFDHDAKHSYRPKGSGSVAGSEFGYVLAASTIAANTWTAITDGDQKIEVIADYVDQNLTINTNGWYIPSGM